MTIWENKKILLGVTGSIACYKVIDLASKLTQAGALVDVIMTEAAGRFVTPLAFRSVTGRPVFTDMWDLSDHVRHVGLGENADLMIIAPATAHTMAKLAHGLADNLLTVTALAARCPLLVAPAMDGGMYEHPATAANVAALQARGVTLIGPAEGRMASGLVGTGRLVEPAELLGHVRLALGRGGALTGRHVVVTAGPTVEAIDPVRYITNHSSGKQGVALAQAALDAGATVHLIAGPLQTPAPVGVQFERIHSARDLEAAVLAALPAADVLLMAAAVGDFRPAQAADQKLKKTEMADSALAIPLARNPDILASVKAQRGVDGRPQVVVGFAAETQDVLRYGQDKLERKGLDFIVVNDVSQPDAGFAVDTNRVTILDREGGVNALSLRSKAAVAEAVVASVAAALAH